MENVALRLIAEIQMVLAEHSAGEIDDRESVAKIRAILDSPQAIAVALNQMPPDTDRSD